MAFKLSLVIVCICISLTFVFCVDTNSTETTTLGTTTSTEDSTGTTKNLTDLSPREKWIITEKIAKKATSDMVKKILPMVLKGAEDLPITPMCTRHLFKMLTAIKKMKLWAFKMLDSSGKLPNGILSGTIASLGDFDECLAVNPSEDFRGKYCLVDVLPPMPKRVPFIPVDDLIPEFENITDDSTLLGQFLGQSQHYYYLNFRTSVCVPSSCNREDIQLIASKVMASTQMGWDINIPNCKSSDPIPWDASEIVIAFVMSIIVLTAAIGTLVDVFYNLVSKDGKSRTSSNLITRIFLCFSFYSNTKRLIKKDTSPDTIKIFHGMKVVTVMWVMLNHTYYYVDLQIMGALLQARKMGTEIAFQLILNGFLNVETFFFISAVLVAYGRMKAKDKDFSIFLYIFRRIWRLTPPFMLVIALTFLTHHMGTGPVWDETVGNLVRKCKVNWWTNLLYFNNFVNSDEMCLQWTWYIPVDTHLYFIALVFLIPIKNHPRIGFSVLGLLFAIGIISTALSNIHYNLHPTAIYAFPHPDDINYYVNHGYFKTYLHTVTYCVGMSVGYLLYSRPNQRIPLGINILGWLTSFVLSLTVLYGVYDWNQGNVPSLAVSTLYTCTNKLVWSLSLGWVTFACYTGNGGIVTKILSWSAFVPLSRLTYMAYLIHPILQHMYIGSTRVVLQTEHRTLSFMFLGHVVAAYIVAYVLSQLFESPFMALEKVMFSCRRPEKSQDGAKPFANGTLNDLRPKTEDNHVFAIKIRQTEP